MPLHDISYQHWQGVHLGLAGRQLVIARNGLMACLQNKWMWHLIVLCWIAALVMVGLLFFVGQLFVADRMVVQWLANLNPGLQTFARMLTTWLEQRPDISVWVTQNVLFCSVCMDLMRAS